MAAERTGFASPSEEREYLALVKGELEQCQTRDDVITVWTRHYLRIGHRKLGRLLIGRPVEAIVKERG